MKNKITELRSQIDQIDDMIADLIEKRIEIAKEIISEKENSGLERFDPGREKLIISRISANSNENNSELMKRIFSLIFGATRGKK